MSGEAPRKIPFFNYQALFKENEGEFIAVIEDIFRRGAYILQDDLRKFEESMRGFLSVKYAFGVADGTNALILGLRAMGIHAGDEVIVPSHTYVASAASIHFVGATPVLADCGADHLVDPDSIIARITSRTRAIMPVHLNGRTCNMDPLMEIARKYDLMVIEDAAQALGSRYRGKNAGTFGAVGTVSFYPAKVLGCFGDGGLVMTNDDRIGELLGMLRDHGRNARGEVGCWGTNCRLDNLHAAVLACKFKSFGEAIEKRRRIAAAYHAGLSDIEDLTLPPPPESDTHFDVFQNYELESGRRDLLRAHLQERGISTIIQWGGKAVHQIEALGFKGVHLPGTERLFQRCFMLPMNTTLADDDVAYIVGAVREFYGRA